MSGALDKVFGGGGILGGLLQIGAMFFPPLAVLNGLGNLLTEAIGGAVNGAIDTLTQQFGMPKFLGNLIKDGLSKLMPGLQEQPDQQVNNFLKDKVGDKFDAFQKEMQSDIVDAFKRYKSDADKANGGGTGAAGKSWFVALMMALGEMQNKQAEKVQKLAGEVSELLGAGDDSNGSKQAQFDKMEEFKAEGKLQEVLANVTKSIGDSIGNSLATVARAQ